MRLTHALSLFLLSSNSAWSQTLVETHKVLASNGAPGDTFGRAVAMSGALAIIGAPQDDVNGPDSGSMFVFDLQTGAQILWLKPTDGAAEEFFGAALSLDGSTALVGAPLDDDNGTHSGSAYIFNAISGSQGVKLLASDGGAGDRFGWAVSVSGMTALVGARWDNDNGPHSGSAYIFDTVSGNQLRKLTPDDGSGGDEFGTAVAVDGNRAIVGAYRNDAKGHDSGAAYIFDTVTGQQIMKLMPVEPAPGSYFGISVALSGNLALVGANGTDDFGPNSGSAYLFDITTGAQLGKLTAADGIPMDNFGIAVALSGTTAIVSAHLAPIGGNQTGAAYVFDCVTLAQIAKLTASDGLNYDNFGYAVALEGDAAVLGAHGRDDLGTDSGCAYFFDGVSVPSNTGNAFCFGDGTGAACPCSAAGDSGAGCANSLAINGAKLTGMGRAYVSNDTFSLQVTGIPGNKPGLILAGQTQSGGSFGTPVGDGLLCIQSGAQYSQLQFTQAGSTTFSDFQGGLFGAASAGVGLPTNYQFWYRDPANVCSGRGFNFSNAWTVTWLP